MTDDRLSFDPPITSGVVVGYDGSQASRRAVNEAADVAVHRNDELHIVRAWQLSNAMGDVEAPAGVVPSLSEVEAAVRTPLEALVAQVRQDNPGLRLTGHVLHAKATEALLAASKSADLVVVSRRGQGGFVDLLLGSTADQVVRYASSSVLVVRSED